MSTLLLGKEWAEETAAYNTAIQQLTHTIHIILTQHSILQTARQRQQERADHITNRLLAQEINKAIQEWTHTQAQIQSHPQSDPSSYLCSSEVGILDVSVGSESESEEEHKEHQLVEHRHTPHTDWQQINTDIQTLYTQQRTQQYTQPWQKQHTAQGEAEAQAIYTLTQWMQSSHTHAQTAEPQLYTSPSSTSSLLSLISCVVQHTQQTARRKERHHALLAQQDNIKAALIEDLETGITEELLQELTEELITLSAS